MPFTAGRYGVDQCLFHVNLFVHKERLFMKRSLLIASLLALGLAACGDKPAATQATAPVAAPAPAPAADKLVEAAAPVTNVAATDASNPDAAATPAAPAAEEKKEENK
jgi:hypothetical protein